MFAGSKTYPKVVEQAATKEEPLQVLHEIITYIFEKSRDTARESLRTRSSKVKQLLFHLLIASYGFDIPVAENVLGVK